MYIDPGSQLFGHLQYFNVIKVIVTSYWEFSDCTYHLLSNLNFPWLCSCMHKAYKGYSSCMHKVYKGYIVLQQRNAIQYLHYKQVWRLDVLVTAQARSRTVVITYFVNVWSLIHTVFYTLHNNYDMFNSCIIYMKLWKSHDGKTQVIAKSWGTKDLFY